MKVNGFDLDIREESVLIEELCASSVKSYVEPVREELMVNTVNRFLQGENTPRAFDLLCSHDAGQNDYLLNSEEYR